MSCLYILEVNLLSVVSFALLYIYIMEYYSVRERNIFEPVLMRWMNPKPIIQCEVSQKEKNKCHILIHMQGIYKNSTNESVCRAGIEVQMERTDLWT